MGESVPTPKPGKPARVHIEPDDFDLPQERMPIVPVRRMGRQTHEPVIRSPHATPVQLNGLRPVIILEGRGGTGKTTAARLILNEIVERGIRRVLIGAVDPGHQMLGEFVAKIRRPDGSGDAAEAACLRDDVLEVAMQHQVPAIVDCGGGSKALATVVRGFPTMVETMEAHGVTPIPWFFFTTSPDDVGMLEDYEELGFTPKNTVLVLNAHLASSPSAYRAVQAQPGYRAALERGAVEIVLPALETKLAQAIESARYHFHQAVLPATPEGMEPLEFSALKQAAVRAFVAAFRVEIAQLVASGWMPWGA